MDMGQWEAELPQVFGILLTKLPLLAAFILGRNSRGRLEGRCYFIL